MSSATDNSTIDDCVYIDLDEPSRWWISLVGIVAAVLIASVLIAPWLIEIDSQQSDAIANTTLQNSGTICRPNAEDVPNIFDPTVASWSRFCEWFIAPESNNQD